LFEPLRVERLALAEKRRRKFVRPAEPVPVIDVQRERNNFGGRNRLFFFEKG
jgi:hypothetical protein